jgi:hypothetical protein
LRERERKGGERGGEREEREMRGRERVERQLGE